MASSIPNPYTYPSHTINHWRTFKLVEWILLAVNGISIFLRLSFYNTTVSIIASVSTITILFLLSLRPPITKGLWHRRAYIVLGLGITEIGDWEHYSFDVPQYFYLLKACLLLPRIDAIWIAVLSGTTMLAGLNIRIPINRALLQQQGLDVILSTPIEKLLFHNAILYTAIYAFVLLTGFVFMEEQRSRQRAEQLTQQVETLAADLERSRIARDIHDALGHSLTTLDVQLELAQSLYDRDVPPELLQSPYYQDLQRAIKSIDIAKKLSSKCLQDVRYALHAMHRSNFDLNQASLTLIEQFNHSQNLRIHHHFDFPQLPLQIGYQLYCVAQEALTNIQKHAAASQVDIKGAKIDEHICMTIEDNGQGFDHQAAHTGFGLQNMRDRVLSLGGQFEVHSRSQGGTQLRVLVPLGMPAASAEGQL
jgi:signal transduction histidine kinase